MLLARSLFNLLRKSRSPAVLRHFPGLMAMFASGPHWSFLVDFVGGPRGKNRASAD